MINMKRLIGLATIILILNTVQVFAEGKNYELGSKGPAGGFVFYDKGIYSEGWRYLEAAPNDSTVIAWSNVLGSRIGTTKTEIGTGQANTTTIVSQPGHSMSAAKLCNNIVINNFSDWFLPSKDELDLVYKNLCKKGLGGFSTSKNYWSSSEGTLGGSNAWAQQFYIEGYQIETYKDDKYCRVRCVRAF